MKVSSIVILYSSGLVQVVGISQKSAIQSLCTVVG